MNVTYLFGAGASIGAIPVVKETQNGLKRFREFIQYPPEIEGILTLGNMPKISNEQKKLQDNTDWLINSLSSSVSIDTFAKKLFLRRKKDEYIRLKKLMIVYFFYEHYKNNKVNIDPRYENFFASIIQKDILQLPPKLKILSWNYDIQFELAFGEFIEEKKLSPIQSHLQVYRSNEDYNFNKNKFGIIKLNGSLQINTLNDDILIVPDLINQQSNTLLKKILFIQNELDKIVGFPHFFFSWDTEDTGSIEKNYANKIIQVAKNACKDTEVLVVIGYSFPFFNREVDANIINSMNLKKVYFQAPGEATERYYSEFQSIRQDIPKDQIILRKNSEPFLLPPELEL